LSGGSGPWEGIVEMRRHTVKGTVCSTGFDDADAAVICRFLGFSSKYLSCNSRRMYFN
jgi:hypothetical protein